MAYTLQSLITILEKILNPQQTLWIVDHNKPQLESLLQKATSLLQILDKSPLTKIEFLESQIRDAAHEAEDIIESHMVDQMLSNPEAVGLTFSTPDLHPVMQQLDSAMEQVAKLVEGKTGSSSGASFSRNVDSVRSKALVGVDEDLMQLRDRLTGYMRKQLEIVPIVGMGGIGKTTLARKLYEDPSIVSHFKPAHAWATVSQDYDIKAILLSLLHCIKRKESDQHAGKESDQLAGKEIEELKVILHQSLCGRRYMIVLDDIWGIKLWDEIRMFFPENNLGSRIVITTRESEVAKHASSQSVQHQMQPLNKVESWNLLRQEVFGDQEDCPHFLQGIGEKISRDCGGLPLAINVIGGLLSKVERSRGVWESIAKNVASAIVEADDRFSDILSLSYSHLPNHLKPCFLYMGAFPEDHRIEGSRLVRMWMAEGFVKSNGNKSLEEEAEGCLKALVERNLIFVSKYEHLKPKYYGIHDLLRDLCIRKSNEDKFLSRYYGTSERSRNLSSRKFLYVGNRRMCVVNSGFDILLNPAFDSRSKPLHMCCVEPSFDFRRKPLHNTRPLFAKSSFDFSPLHNTRPSYAKSEFWFIEHIVTEKSSIPLARSFIMIGSMLPISPNSLTLLRLVRVLDLMAAKFHKFPMEILQLVNLRFLALGCYSKIPSGISRLKNLQTLIATGMGCDYLTSEIFAMSELRHLHIIGDFYIDEEDMKAIAPNKLQTVSLIRITESLIRRGFLESIPDIKHLELHCEYAELTPGAVDLRHLHKLETLTIRYRSGKAADGLSTFAFPSGLRELVVHNHVMSPSVMTTLCALPNLEVLEMVACEFAREGDNREWEVAEGDKFQSLQVLHIKYSNLGRWGANETNFPRLRHLLLYDCPLLEEIPSGIGEIPTLELIELYHCRDCAVASARQILKEQQCFANDTLQLRIDGNIEWEM